MLTSLLTAEGELPPPPPRRDDGGGAGGGGVPSP